MCEFVASPEPVKCFMIGDDAGGSWKPVAAQLFTRKFSDAISLDMCCLVAIYSKR